MLEMQKLEHEIELLDAQIENQRNLQEYRKKRTEYEQELTRKAKEK